MARQLAKCSLRVGLGVTDKLLGLDTKRMETQVFCENFSYRR